MLLHRCPEKTNQQKAGLLRVCGAAAFPLKQHAGNTQAPGLQIQHFANFFSLKRLKYVFK